jgi:predicted 3-demethylubiquinone-9 3-methyltransferase (glyoxalase superfamily)
MQINTQKITPFLWFENNAEEAMNFYVSVFKNSKVIDLMKMPDGSVMGGSFELEGLRFMSLNGGPNFQFTPAISFFVNCETQEEIDYLWEKLSASESDEQCGWLKDKFGLSWQIIPSVLGGLIGGPDPRRAQNAMQAMLKMKKIVIDDLQKAYDQE